MKTEALISLLAKFANVGGKILEDGKINLDDLVHLYDIFKLIPELQEVDFKGSFAEIKAGLTVEQYDSLIGKLVVDFDIPQDSIETKIEASFDALGDVLSAIGKIKAAWGKADA